MLPIALRACLLRVQLWLFWYIFFFSLLLFYKSMSEKKDIKAILTFSCVKVNGNQNFSFISQLSSVFCCCSIYDAAFQINLRIKLFMTQMCDSEQFYCPRTTNIQTILSMDLCCCFFCTLNLILIYLHWKHIFQEKKVCFFFFI